VSNSVSYTIVKTVVDELYLTDVYWTNEYHLISLSYVPGNKDKYFTVLQTDTSELVEYTKEKEIITPKELGKMYL